MPEVLKKKNTIPAYFQGFNLKSISTFSNFLKYKYICSHTYKLWNRKKGVFSRQFLRMLDSCSLSLIHHGYIPLAELLMHKAHKNEENTSGASKPSSDSVEFDSMVCLKTKPSVCQTLSWKEKAIVFTTETVSAYQYQLIVFVFLSMWCLWHRFCKSLPKV